VSSLGPGAAGLDNEVIMNGVVRHGKRDVRVDTVADPTVEEPRDAIVRITSTDTVGHVGDTTRVRGVSSEQRSVRTSRSS
jgi:hypothetical protein